MRFLFVVLCFFSAVTVFGQDVFTQTGKASFYANKFEGRTTSNGEIFKQSELTAAHLTLPFNTMLRVTNLENNKSIDVRVNDRGSFVKGRIIDLSLEGAKQLGFVDKGLANVKIEKIDKAQTINVSASTGKPPEKIFKIDTKKSEPQGFGVQIGSFKELYNVMEVTNQIQSDYTTEVFVQSSLVNKVYFYRIILGELTSRKKAENLLKKLEANFPDAFIYTY